MKSFYNRAKKIIWNDLSSLGSFVACVILVILLFFFNVELSIRLFLAFVGIHIIVVFIRAIVYRERPDGQKYIFFIERLDSSSFPSLHASRVGIVATLSYGSAVFVPVAAISLLVAISRYVLKRHHATDLIAGYVLGVLVGILGFIVL